MDKFKVDDICEEVKEALKTIGDKHSVKFHMMSGSYDSFMYRIRGEFREEGDANNISHEQNQWNRYCHRGGLKESHFGMSITHKGTTYKIVGWKARARKNQVVLLNEADGRSWRFPAMLVKSAIG